MDQPLPTIAVLGASGLIGEFAATWLARDGFPIVPMARRFSPAQKMAFGPAAVECPIVALDADALARILVETKADIVVNCIGVLQDGPRGSTDAVHRVLVERLLAALGSKQRPA